MDTETSYWDQYDVYDMEQSLQVAQQLPPLTPLVPQADEFRYAPYLSSCSVSSQDSYWSRHLGTRPAGSSRQCTPGGADSVRQTPQTTHSAAANLRRLLVVPDKLAALSLDCTTTRFDMNGSGNSSDSGCDVNEYDVQIVASGPIEGDDATLVVVTAVTPPPLLELLPDGVKSSSHEINSMCRGSAQPQQLKPAVALGRSQSDMCCAVGDGSGPKNASHVANPAIDDSPPSSPGLCFAGVNANALITRLNFLKDQMDQDELLMSLVV
ncbi:hypothetical protein GGI24_002712 [Coemansia furcata]|nr:hypothetical protein GGI24_002712 [Coemansia furcata]